MLFNNATAGGTVNLNISKVRQKQRITPSIPPHLISPLKALLFDLLVSLIFFAGTSNKAVRRGKDDRKQNILARLPPL
jgi:hypothetical protein